MDIPVIGRYSDGKRLLCNFGLHNLVRVTIFDIDIFTRVQLGPILYSDVCGLGGRVAAVGGVITSSTRSVGIVTLEHGMIFIKFKEISGTLIVLVGIPLIASVTTHISTVNELLLRQ